MAWSQLPGQPGRGGRGRRRPYLVAGSTDQGRAEPCEVVCELRLVEREWQLIGRAELAQLGDIRVSEIGHEEVQLPLRRQLAHSRCCRAPLVGEAAVGITKHPWHLDAGSILRVTMLLRFDQV